MPRIVRDIYIQTIGDRYKLPLHRGADFLGFTVLSELHNDFAVSWWLDDESLPATPMTVYCILSGEPLLDERSYHLFSHFHKPHGHADGQGVHLFRTI